MRAYMLLLLNVNVSVCRVVPRILWRRGSGSDVGGVTNHIKAYILHLLKDQRDLFIEGPYIRENTGVHILLMIFFIEKPQGCMPMVSAVHKLIILSDNYSYRILVFLVYIAETQHRSNVSFSLQILHGWVYILAQHRWSQLFRSPDIGDQIVDVSDSWSFYSFLYKP